jgi:CO dehydrogenase/acetyl-CoA synthase beta subunit
MKRGRVTYEGYLASQLAKNKPGESDLPLSPGYKESFLGSDKMERVPKDLPEDLVYEPTADEMDMTNKDVKEYEYKMESPMTRQIAKPEKEPEEDSSKYAGTEAEVEETLKGLEETSKKK